MPATIYYDKDADLSLLKNKTIAILGYGSQGHGHAQNLRDSGCNVIVAELPGTANYEQAVKDGFQPLPASEAVKRATSSRSSCPTSQGDVFRTQIRDNLARQHPCLLHGFNYHFGQFDIPKGVSAILVAPRVGHLVRRRVRARAGVPCLRGWEGAGDEPARSAWPTPRASAAPAPG